MKIERNRLRKIVAGFLLAGTVLIQASFGQSTNGPILGLSKTSASQPALLQWTSHTNEIYRIDYTSDLTTKLTTAAENIPNQGTNTVWADLGTESSSYPRLSSADVSASNRFYRIAVTGYSSNDFPATITVSNVTGSSVLTGITNIYASITTSSNVTSGSLLLDGNQVDFGSGSDYNFTIDTRLFPNGIHRLTLSVADDGDNGTTGGDDPVPDPSLNGELGFASKNVSVVFSNFLSDVHIKYVGYRPDLGETQEVYGTWASPRNWEVDITSFDDTNTVYRSFTGSGSEVFVQWDGLDTNGMELSPQRLNYVVYDLGAASMMMGMTSGRGAFASPSASETPEESIVWVQPSDGSAAPVPLALFPPGMDTNGLVVVPAPAPPARPESSRSAASFAAGLSGGGTFSPMDSGFTNDPVIVSGAHKVMGSFGMLYQGDHTTAGVARPPRGLPFGQVTFTPSFNPLWGKLKSVYKIADYVGSRFPLLGYTNNFIYGDDAFQAAALQKSSLGGSNIFNNVNLCLYVGHSAACKENLVALGHPQTYIPVFTKATGSCTWVGMNDMSLGSSTLKWAAFYSCNLFRDSMYRANGCYAAMKNNNHLAMKGSLHIMQAYATEVTVRHDMGEFWLRA